MNVKQVRAALRAHRAELRDLGVLHLGVSGSVARGEERTDSDIDLVVQFDEAQEFSLVDLARLKSRLTDLLGADVDLIVQPIQKQRLRASVEEDLVRAF